ncbi:PepSY-associated TM helix domain-containing protein [Novosphingobium naphthalenivorans]|uniref:PepSY-associated TM helix domain-containing protein n=1 Tax=Novosphingobium naphthalenivorans TaxID=273168 RepID=UPI00082AD344|nr:PepSY-associated TM helix domain-containing protein [Novosphingobium naphthalenivorans]
MTRKTYLSFHRWLALAFAPLLMLQALTGAVLLFRDSLAQLADPAGMTRESPPGQGQASVSRLRERAAAALPGCRVTRLFLPTTPTGTAFAHLSCTEGALRYASLDPGSARVLAAGTIWRFPLEAALQLHYRLMDSKLGLAVVLANGVALCVLAATGFLFWWPGRGRVRRSLTIRAGAPPHLRLRQWHRSTGVIVSALLLFSATSGVLLVVPDLAAPTNAGASAGERAVPMPDPGQIDRAVASAQARFPAARLRDIRFPAADRLDINFCAPARNPRAVHVVSVSLPDAKVLRAIPAAENPVLWMTILPLHTGDSFGLGGRLLLLAGALSLAFLAGSGPLMWWRARRNRGKVKR